MDHGPERCRKRARKEWQGLRGIGYAHGVNHALRFLAALLLLSCSPSDTDAPPTVGGPGGDASAEASVGGAAGQAGGPAAGAAGASAGSGGSAGAASGGSAGAAQGGSAGAAAGGSAGAATGGSAGAQSWWKPPVKLTWQWQLDGTIDTTMEAEVYDVDLFDTEASVVQALHAKGAKVICYMSAGSWEEWRPDKDLFPPEVIGNDYPGWSGEKFIDIRAIAKLAPVMQARMDQCKSKGFDALEPDNIDTFEANTGFNLTAQDQLAYNQWLAEQAHARGLSIGLKNDAEQAAALEPFFDWVLTEDCFDQDWCADVSVFVNAAKPVLMCEYTDTGIVFANACAQASQLQFNAILKHRDLDAWRQVCP